MKKSKDLTEQNHIDAVLEPIASGSQYEFVEITSHQINAYYPIPKLLIFIKSGIGLVYHFISSQKKIIFFVLFALITVEMILRIVEPRLLNRIYSESLTGGFQINMNKQGFRGNSVDFTKDLNTTRILALGDSVTFGTGQSVQNTWPAQLQKLLSTEKHPVEVINTGLPAMDLKQIHDELADRWSKFKPEHAILMVTGNIISLGYSRRKQVNSSPRKLTNGLVDRSFIQSNKDKLMKIYMSFALPGMLTIGVEHFKYSIGLIDHAVNPVYPVGVMLPHGYIQNGIDDTIIDQVWLQFENQLKSLASKSTALGIKLTVIYSPPRFVLSESRVDNMKWVDKNRLVIDPVKRINKICQKIGLKFIDPRASLAKASKPVYMLSDYTHFDTSGHKALAKLIANSINEK